MSQLLVIRSSATGAASVTNRLIDGFLADLRGAAPDVAVVDHDLDADPLPHITSQTLAGIGRPAPETDAAKPTRALSDALIAELEASDVIVLGAPMYNFGIASTLKSWFDHVLRAGATFRYTANGPEGLLQGKRAIIVAARAGLYSEGAAAMVDHQLPYLKTLLGFMGVTDVTTVLAEGLAGGADQAEQSIAAAAAALSEQLDGLAGA